MSTLNKFVIYKCDTCNRKTEILIDGKRPDPVRCNITYKCRGKLQRVGESTSKKFLLTPPIAGLQDYVQRGTQLTASVNSEDEASISLFTGGGSGMLTMAVPTRTELGTTHTFEVIDSSNNKFILDSEPDSITLPTGVTANLILFKISPELLQFKKYTYLVSGYVQVIQGADDSPSKNNLKFTATNKVRVFINGIELDASEFDRTTPDLIKFTPAIYESNNVVDVIVYNNLTSSSNLESVKLEFNVLSTSVSAQLSLLCADSWGDAKGAEINGVTRYLLHCTDLSELTPDFSYGVSAVEISNGSETRIVKPSEVYFLLGHAPFSTYDKELFSYIKGDDLISSSNVLAYGQNQETGATDLTIKEGILTNLGRAIIPTGISKIESVIDETLVVQNNIKRQYILGPV